MSTVQEIHLAGHERRADESGRPLLVDTHDRAVDRAVWGLYAHVVETIGCVPTLVEWDARVPAWSTLLAQAQRADAVMRTLEEA